MKLRFAQPIVVILLLVVVAYADNWPQWRGPNLNGLSGEKNLPSRWSPEENIVWKLPLPSWSGSTPIIWRDLIFLNVAEGDNLSLWCVNRKKGDVLWKSPLGSWQREDAQAKHVVAFAGH